MDTCYLNVSYKWIKINTGHKQSFKKQKWLSHVSSEELPFFFCLHSSVTKKTAPIPEEIASEGQKCS